ncbi:MAG: FxsA family protein [Alphaproteobacteria bacterium]|nr:FxsA family protein [Alphaproteobacteria bacterium]MCY4230736.1 FxsA family protein [Alphaproteobacteria bacterium]MCY4319721.1 FxsA family protein [Alphaproteobacteria bacterium]
MAFAILLALIGVPLIEIAVFIEVGGWIGLWPTLAVIVLTAMTGTWLIRAQGLGVLRRAKQSISEGAAPLRQLFDGVCLIVAGALLLTPGFFTDAAGFLLLLPPFRDLVAGWTWRRWGSEARAWRGEARIIEGDYRDDTPGDSG